HEFTEIAYRVVELATAAPLQTSNIFISYSHTDAAFVDALERKLLNAGILYWRDIHHSVAGPLEKQVDRAMRQNPTVLLVLSQHSVDSDWVQHEARTARELAKELNRPTLCPVALDDAWKTSRWPARLREQIEEFNILPFDDWQDADALEAKFRNRLLPGL